MELDGVWEVFFGGTLGPVLVELIKLAAWRDKAKTAEKCCHWNCGIATCALLLVSGIVVIMNGIDHVPLQKAVQLGINAPAIVADYASASVVRRQRRAQRAGFIAGPESNLKRFSRRTTELLAW